MFGTDDFGIVYSQLAPVQRLGARLTIVVLTLYYILVSSQRDRLYFCALSLHTAIQLDLLTWLIL